MIELLVSETCSLCQEVKAVLDKVGIEWRKLDRSVVDLHDGWRNDGSDGYAAGFAMNERMFPVFFFDGKYVDTPTAFRNLKLGLHLHEYRKRKKLEEKEDSS